MAVCSLTAASLFGNEAAFKWPIGQVLTCTDSLGSASTNGHTRRPRQGLGTTEKRLINAKGGHPERCPPFCLTEPFVDVVATWAYLSDVICVLTYSNVICVLGSYQQRSAVLVDEVANEPQLLPTVWTLHWYQRRL